jgi:hypothetical protein
LCDFDELMNSRFAINPKPWKSVFVLKSNIAFNIVHKLWCVTIEWSHLTVTERLKQWKVLTLILWFTESTGHSREMSQGLKLFLDIVSDFMVFFILLKIVKILNGWSNNWNRNDMGNWFLHFGAMVSRVWWRQRLTC